MNLRRDLISLILAIGAGLSAAAEQSPVSNWAAPPYWAPAASEAAHARTAEGRQALAGSPTALPFISLTPCRVVDTRGNAPLTGGFLPAATVRSYTVTGICGIPAGAQALSLNATVVHPTGSGFLVLYPQGGTFPPVSTLNFLGNDVIVNAAVVPISLSGGISMALGVSGGDVILDVNGYYAPVPSVTSLNTQTGDVSLVAGTNVTITPGTGTLTIASTGGSGGPPTGPAGGGLAGTYPNPALAANSVGSTQIAAGAVTDAKVASGISYSKLTGVPGFVLKSGDTMTGALTLDPGNINLKTDPSTSTSGSILKNGTLFLHNAGTDNTNIFAGINAGNAANTGSGNAALGNEALGANTTGYDNTASGLQALRQNTTGHHNTASGYQALWSNTGGNYNVATGDFALFANTTGQFNTASGDSALGANTTGNFNTASGSTALPVNTTGSFNVAAGYQALLRSTTGSTNIAIGYLAGQALTTGDNNIVIGNSGSFGAESNAIHIGTSGSHARAYLAGVRGVATGFSDGLPVFVDSNGQLGTAGGTITATSFSGSLAGDVTGTQGATVVSSVGGSSAANVHAAEIAANASTSALSASTIVRRDASGNFSANVVSPVGIAMAGGDVDLGSGGFILRSSSRFVHDAGVESVFVGRNAGGYSAPSAQRNSALGFGALSGLTSGQHNVAGGYFAATGNTTGSYGTALGSLALLGNSAGSNNVAIGYSALHSTNADGNTAVGANALFFNVSGTANVAVGQQTLYNATSSNNTGVGALALNSTTSGTQNTALGTNAGSRFGAGTGYGGSAISFVPNTTGSYNTFVGHGTGATASVSNCTAVGIDAYCDGNDQVRLGNSFVGSIGGKVGWSALSDARAKEDVRDLERGLDLVLALRPVSYRLRGGNGRTDLGFLAQDVEALLGQGYGVLSVGGDADRTLSLRYQDFIAPLVKAVQEQQARIEKQQARIEEQQARIEKDRDETRSLRERLVRLEELVRAR